MNYMRFRWAGQAALIFTATSFAGASLISNKPLAFLELAFPAAVVLAVTIAAWPLIVSKIVRGDSKGTITAMGFALGVIGLVASGIYIMLRTNTWRDDPGEQGGAILLIMFFFAAIPSLIATPLAIILPRVLDPALRPKCLTNRRADG